MCGVGRVAFPQRDEAGRVVRDLARVDDAGTLRRAQPAGGDEAAEVRVAGTVLRQQHQRAAVANRHLRADDDPHAVLPAGHVRADDARHAVAVGDRQRRHPHRLRVLDQLVGV
jgi:hypothetical protein